MRKMNTVTYHIPIFSFRGHAGNITSANTIPATTNSIIVDFPDGSGNVQA